MIAIGEGYNEFCEMPDGYISYLPKGCMNAIILMDNRAKPSSAVPTDDEKIKLFGSIIATGIESVAVCNEFRQSK